ncbi:hypothetical protein, partial [Escherichia coli]|uniref:hypothetical protein n=1 Tax=Escherichia coli TaxID=562 RepID=UPI001BFC1132
TNMRISNIEWLKKRIGFIRKLGEQTARQRQIIDLLDNEAGLTGVSLEIGNFCTLSALFNQSWFVRG